jgi:RNA 2',3'-cyclic 3'-phosphodiesterase
VKRLFIAVDVDDVTRDAIGRISSGLRERSDARLRVSWVRPDRMHLTLHFDGHADERMERRMFDALADPLPEAPFSLSFEGLGFFPPRGSPRVLWLGVRGGLAELRRVQQILAGRILGGCDQPFSPHLTLGRIRDRMPRGQIKEMASIPASAGPCRIDRVTLYESRLSPAGPTYLRLAEAPFTT